MIKLGQKVRCIVTGFTGIAISKVEYLNGCVQYCVKPPVVDNKSADGEYIDQQQLEVVDDGVAVKKNNTGGVMSDMPKGNGLSRR
ncbi:hypothetical protein DYU11_20215 [Fibrisoma montanum]|uniref:Uncharacterized protein n=1 Tax=Fibrisoma montanum TaxID=2305895 RepID=A0A418M3N2_9BACT|nr:hypothetical protein [Fibrisoma montanum]RIV20378.1 hypothetical protein DYU11_20215 [Fibrisoma montanum]